MGECEPFPLFPSKRAMKEDLYTGTFAGAQLTFAFRHPDTARCFQGWLKPACTPSEAINPIRVPLSDCEYWIREYGMKDDCDTEFGMSVYRASDQLVKKNRCVVHGAAMVWREKAWLFMADSGTGKSTQLDHWKTLWPEEVQILNGDKPVLRLEDDGTFTVHPSPWKGKEDWGDDSLSAPLGGIILLKKNNKNHIDFLSPSGCAAKLLSLFFFSFEDRMLLDALCALEEKIISSVPIWRLSNLGDQESSRLTYKTLLAWCENMAIKDNY